MTGSRPGEPTYTQTNNGAGTFIGGHNFGTVESVDAKTKAVLNKLSIEAPALAKLLRKALQDGLISPDIASSLEMAARNINWDIAEALYIAGENINMDVAMALSHAGDNINMEVATRIDAATDRLKQVALQLNEAQATAQRTSEVATLKINKMEDAATKFERTSQGSATTTGRDWSWKSFRWGMACCFIAVFALLALYTYATKK
jgi:hypothetical protein